MSAFRGIDALHLARERYPDVPFIFVSGGYGEERVVESMKEGATDYVLKDHLGRLGPVVRRALEEATHRRDQERAEHQLRLLADRLPWVISYVDPQSRYQFVNESYHRWFGLTTGEMIGRPIWEVMGHAAYEVVRPYVERALAGEQVEFEALIPFKILGPRWVSATYTPDLGPDGKVAGFFVLATDITARKKVEERSAFLAEATALLLSSLDYETTLVNIARLAVPRVADWCALCFEANGHVRPLEIVHQDPERIGRLKSLLARYPLPTALSFAYPKVLRTGMWDLVSDLTEEHLRAASENQENLELLKQIGFRSLLTVPLIVAGRTVAALTLANSDSERRFTREDVAFAEELARRAALAMENARLYREVRRDSDALQDLNEHLEQRVQERTSELEEITKELDAFASTVAHDLRAPLRVMKAFSEILVEDYSGRTLDTVGEEYARKIDRASDRMAGLVDDLLAYSRLSRQDVPIHEVELETEVSGVVSDMGDELRAADAEVAVERPLPRVWANEGLLAQVLANLVSNAVKFRAAGRPARVRIRAVSEGDEVVLWVEDNGIGIAREHFDRIFKVFERLHSQEAYPGSGLGLAIARRSIERMGGSIGVESEPGHGSRFWIRFRSAPEHP
jgi:PAS domain S-box-containing protein